MAAGTTPEATWDQNAPHKSAAIFKREIFLQSQIAQNAPFVIEIKSLTSRTACCGLR